MPLRQRFDRLLLAAVVLQLSLGLAVLGSASWLVASVQYGTSAGHFLVLQAVAAAIGLGAMVAAMHLRLDLLLERRVAWAALAACWGLLVVALLEPALKDVHRWVRLGPLSLQPSVPARYALVVLAAVLLPAAAREGWTGRSLTEVAGATAVTGALVFVAPDLGSAVLVVATVGVMAFAAGTPLRLLAIPVALALALGAVAVAAAPYRLERARAFLHPTAPGAERAAYQTRQALIALGSGGLTGLGYGRGRQKLFFLPEPHTDSVLAAAGEELGLAGVAALGLGAGLIVWRGLRVAARQADPRRALLATGIAAAFALQALLHAAVCLGLAPTTGVPLPLVSYGKTDLVVTLGGLGLLLNLSREVRP